MAAEVRRWIFEMDAVKQAAQQYSHLPEQREKITNRKELQAAEQKSSLNYYLTAEIAAIRHPPYHAVRPGHVASATLIQPRHDTRFDPSSNEKLLLFGPPVSSAVRAGIFSLRKGDRVGIRRGLVWEMDIEVGGGGWEGGGRGARMEKWIVGAEWDVLAGGVR
jgi:hypothetical protein